MKNPFILLIVLLVSVVLIAKKWTTLAIVLIISQCIVLVCYAIYPKFGEIVDKRVELAINKMKNRPVFGAVLRWFTPTNEEETDGEDKS